VITTSHRSLPTQHTTNTRYEHPCPQRDSNQRSQQSSGCRHATLRPLGRRDLRLG